MEAQTLIVSHRISETEYFRKALTQLKGLHEFTVKERQEKDGIIFYITSSNSLFFFKLGEAFGQLKEFHSKK